MSVISLLQLVVPIAQIKYLDEVLVLLFSVSFWDILQWVKWHLEMQKHLGALHLLCSHSYYLVGLLIRVWALVAQGLVMHCFMVLVVWVLHPWRPLFVFSIDSFRSLFRFGSRLLGVGLMNATYENLYQIIIGKLYMATDLGFF